MSEYPVFAVPARAGSVRLPGKNFRLLGGIPLFAWSVWFAAEAAPTSRIILSTDYEPLLDFNHSLGFLEIVRRPTALSGSDVSTEDWLRHLILDRTLGVAHVALLQPTSPFRSRETFTELLALSDKHPNQSLFSGRGVKPNGNLYMVSTSQILNGVSISDKGSLSVAPKFEWEDIDIDNSEDWVEAENSLKVPEIKEMLSRLFMSPVGERFKRLPGFIEI